MLSKAIRAYSIYYQIIVLLNHIYLWANVCICFWPLVQSTMPVTWMNSLTHMDHFYVACLSVHLSVSLLWQLTNLFLGEHFVDCGILSSLPALAFKHLCFGKDTAETQVIHDKNQDNVLLSFSYGHLKYS